MNRLAIATGGIGFGALAVATMGFVLATTPPQPPVIPGVGSAGGGLDRYQGIFVKADVIEMEAVFELELELVASLSIKANTDAVFDELPARKDLAPVFDSLPGAKADVGKVIDGLARREKTDLRRVFDEIQL